MKILRLDLRAFGPFTDLGLDLSAGREGLHLIFGPNEAGKSSALRALRQMLYGIDPRTTDRFLHDYDRLRVGGTLRHADGAELAFLRRKGLKRVLLAPDESADLDDHALDRFLAGVGREQFETTFGLDHEGLLAGGRAIAEGEGLVGELVFGAGTDLRSLRRLQQQIERQYSDLFKLRGENPPLNRDISALGEARRDVEASSIRSSEWHDHRARLVDAHQERARLESELADLQREASRLLRMDQALADVVRLRELNAILAELADVPRLREGFSEERRSVEEALRVAQRSAEAAEVELNEVDARLGELPPPGPILAQSEAIEGLQRRLAVHLKEAVEVDRLSIECHALESSARSALRELGREGDLSAADSLRISLPQRERIRKLSEDRQQLIFECDSTYRAVETLVGEREAVERPLLDLPAPRDVEPLRRAIQEAQAHGDLKRRIDEASREVSRLERLATTALARLGPWSGSLDEVDTLPAPSAETIEAYREALDSADRIFRDLTARVEEAESQSADLDAKIARSKMERQTPSEADLRAARERRALGWRLVKFQWRSRGVDPEAIRAFAGEADLAAAYERSVEEADEIADRLRADADRVAELAGWVAERQRLSDRLSVFRTKLSDAEADRRRVAARWSKLWEPLGFEPLSPREMHAWVLEHRTLAEQVQAIRDRRAEVEETAVLIATLRAEVSGRLLDLGEPAAAPGESLASLIHRAAGVVEQAETVEARRRELHRERDATERRLSEARRQDEDARRRYSAWREAWGEAMRPIALSPEALPDEANATIDRIVTLRRDLDAADSHRRRIEAFHADRARLSADATALARRVASDLATADLAGAIEGMADRLARAKTDAARRLALEEQRERLLAQVGRSRSESEDARDRLALLVREARCRDLDALPDVEARADRRRQAEAEREGIEARLRKLSGGTDLSAFVAQVVAIDADSIASRIAANQERIELLVKRKEDLSQTIGREQNELDRMDETAREARASEAACRAEELVSRIESEAGRYVRLRLASAVLREAIERYRERSQGPVLRRASELFSRLTCGSFSGLTTQLDDEGHPLLVGVRPGGATLGVRAMSEGTADQLFLALKLASLEHHLDHNEPMPFVADDLLVNFDDRRSIAALEVLAELSQRTQVLFFTHHRHLVELAEATLAPDVLFTHELFSSTGAARRTKARAAVANGASSRDTE